MISHFSSNIPLPIQHEGDLPIRQPEKSDVVHDRLLHSLELRPNLASRVETKHSLSHKVLTQVGREESTYEATVW